MDKAHDVQDVQVSGTTLKLLVDAKPFECDLTKHSARLAEASQAQREHFEAERLWHPLA